MAHKNKEDRNKYMREYNKRNPDKVKERWLKTKYNVSLQEYNTMYNSQNGCCKICETHEKNTYRGKLCVDHDHVTGKIRGLLCNVCNTALGQLKDSQLLLERAMKYLKGELV